MTTLFPTSDSWPPPQREGMRGRGDVGRSSERRSMVAPRTIVLVTNGFVLCISD